MTGKDHRALAFFLMRETAEILDWRKKWHCRLFLLGSVSPDYNPLTYLRGIRKSHAMVGHHALYSERHVRKCLNRLQTRGIRHLWDYFSLGTLMHYIADSFTYPHSALFAGDMVEHRRYELALHRHFPRYLSRCPDTPAPPFRGRLIEFLNRERRDYDRGEKNFTNDCRHIVESCSRIFRTLALRNA